MTAMSLRRWRGGRRWWRGRRARACRATRSQGCVDVVVVIIQFIIARAALRSIGDGCEVVHLQKRGAWRRVEHIWAFPWRLHFDALEFDGFRMERKYFVGLLKRKLEIV